MSTHVTKHPFSVALKPTGSSFVAYPHAHNPRWLLPADKTLRSSGLNLYTPQKFKGQVLKRLMAWGWVRGEAVWIEDIDILLEQFAEVLGRGDLFLAFSAGTPGAYQKVTAQIMAANGEVLAYAKIAGQEYARHALRAERNNLTKLNEFEFLRPHVPQVLAGLKWRDFEVVVTSPGPERQGPKRFNQSHAEFLRKLQAAFGEEMPFGESNMWRKMNELYAELTSQLSDAWAARYAYAMALIEKQLGGVTLPLTLAHRDFTPWNTHIYTDGLLYVFDWEFAAKGYLVNYDRSHFQFMSSLLVGFFSASGKRWIKSLGQKERMMVLTYIVDLGLFYSQALFARGGAEDDLVLSAAATILDQAAGV